MTSIKPDSCRGCQLYDKGQGWVLPDGPPKADILIVGEAPGEHEAHQGKPFVGEAGFQLNRTFSFTSNLRRENFRVTNCIQCRPPQNFLEGAPWEFPSLGHCRPNMEKAILDCRPKVIIALGGIALRTLLGLEGILEGRCPKRGYVYDMYTADHHSLVVPTVHPSYILRGAQNLVPVQIMDFQKAHRVAREGEKREEPRYVQYPTPLEVEDFIREAQNHLGNQFWLTADIETRESRNLSEEDFNEIEDAEIERISFAFRSGYAISIPWSDYWLPYIQRIFALSTPFTVFWNADFDVPRIKGKEVRISGRILDGMFGWHWLHSDLPKGLGFVSSILTDLREWKSISSEYPALYSCLDSSAAIQNTYAIRDTLVKQGRWNRFLSHHTDLQPILTEMGQRGVLVDLEARAEFRAYLVGEIAKNDAQIQAIAPPEVCRLQKFKTVPLEFRCRTCKGKGSIVKTRSIKKVKHTEVRPCEECHEQGYIVERIPASKRAGEVEGVFVQKDGKWALRFPFNPDSPIQVRNYLKFKGYPIPRNYKTREDTTGKSELERISKKHPKDKMLGFILEGRGLGKLLHQYVDGYKPGPDGRVRTTFTQKPSTWRLASEKPNVQNVIKRADLAARYRQQFIAAPGHVLWEIDYKSIEAVLVGWFAKDDYYIKAAKIGIHDILASHVLTAQGHFKEPIDIEKWSPADIKLAIKEVKTRFDKQRDDCKHAIHGSGYGATPFKMKMEFPESFPSLKYAEYLQDLYFNTLAKKVRAWQLQLTGRFRLDGERTVFVENPFGYRHYYWDVWRYDGRKRTWVWSTDAKRLLAFLPQSSATAIIVGAMKKVFAIRELRTLVAWQIHDALFGEAHDDKYLKSRLSRLAEIMEEPVIELDGLVIETETKTGINWSQMI